MYFVPRLTIRFLRLDWIACVAEDGAFMFSLSSAVPEHIRSTRARLTKFYRIWNPTKLNEVNKIARMFEGREMELWKTLKKKYIDRSRLPELQRERDEGIYTMILIDPSPGSISYK